MEESGNPQENILEAVEKEAQWALCWGRRKRRNGGIEEKREEGKAHEGEKDKGREGEEIALSPGPAQKNRRRPCPGHVQDHLKIGTRLANFRRPQISET